MRRHKQNIDRGNILEGTVSKLTKAGPHPAIAVAASNDFSLITEQIPT